MSMLKLYMPTLTVDHYSIGKHCDKIVDWIYNFAQGEWKGAPESHSLLSKPNKPKQPILTQKSIL